MQLPFTTGLPGLDKVFKGVMPGDNIVWQIDSIDDYRALVVPFTEASAHQSRRLIYFRFASYPSLLPEGSNAEVHHLDPSVGFETFITQLHSVIEDAGYGAAYVFDCLSELASAWKSDQMLGNFFVLTCPRLYELETVTYFALQRNAHSSFATDPITSTTQYLLDIFRYKSRFYIRPIKVQYRSTSSMNTIHLWDGDEFPPVTRSALIAEILAAARWPGLHADIRLGFWRRIFNEAQRVLMESKAGLCPADKEHSIFMQLSRIMLSKDERMLELVDRYLGLEELLAIHDRMVGIGFIGGKAVGMLIARAILKKSDSRFGELLETHDSFYIGSDVFYTFLVRNGVWWLRQKQRHPETFLDDIGEAQTKILQGVFINYHMKQFMKIIDYFGESPYIVRSSSLLEDNYGNAFAGKYDSIFCVNQGSRETRLQTLLNAVRAVYASAMSERALRYRHQRGLLDNDEQMALLIMRVSGQSVDNAFYPHAAGVGFSYNPYVWSRDIDPNAGVIRLVFGLGTRAVDRADDDYTRVVALNQPSKRPESNFDEVCEYSQRKMDYLDLAANKLVSGSFSRLASENTDLPMDLIASPAGGGSLASPTTHWILTFDHFLNQTPFVNDMKQILQILEKAYDHPVDIEFAVNFMEDRSYRINLLQCRPLQVQGMEQISLPDVEIKPEDRIIEAKGGVVGRSRILDIDRFIYVVPSLYGVLPVKQRYEIARLIGHINRACAGQSFNTMLIGPGRWGTSSPELGIPVHFAEIDNVSVVCEIVTMRENLIPDVSLGTHFLNELVEMNMLYLALFPHYAGNEINESFFLDTPNHLTDILPNAHKWQDMIRVFDAGSATSGDIKITLMADAMEQRVVIFSDKKY